MKNTYPNKRNINTSPLRNSPITRSSGSVPRSYKSSEKKIEQNFKNNTDNIRFITGDRLRPMHKKAETFKSKILKTRTTVNPDMRIKELNADNLKNSQELKEKIREKEKNYNSEREAQRKSFDYIDSSSGFRDSTETKEKNNSESASSRSNQDTESGLLKSSEKLSIATQVDFFDRNMLKSMRNKAAVVIQKY